MRGQKTQNFFSFFGQTHKKLVCFFFLRFSFSDPRRDLLGSVASLAVVFDRWTTEKEIRCMARAIWDSGKRWLAAIPRAGRNRYAQYLHVNRLFWHHAHRLSLGRKD